MMELQYLCFLPHFTSAETFYVTTNPNLPCPDPDQPCHTLSQYAAQPPSNSSNVTMVFLEGTHNLSCDFSLTNFSSLTLENATPGTETTISCSDDGRFTFDGIEYVLISNVVMLDCYGSNITYADYLAITDSVIQGALNSSSRVTLYLSDIKELDIIGSTFAFNKVMQLMPLSCAMLDVRNSNNMKLYHSVFHQNSVQSAVNESPNIGCALCIHNSKVTIIGSNFTNNSAYNQNSSLRSTIILALSSDITIQDSGFINNQARAGGAVLSENSTIRVLRTTFFNNSAIDGGGAVFLSAYGTSQLTLDNCTIINNYGKQGGAVHSDGNNILAIESTFANNYADKYGGVAYLSDNGSFTVDNCTISENSCGIEGGVMYIIQDSKLEARNTLFQQNSALSIIDAGYGNGGVMVLSSSHAVFINCSFVGNKANISGTVSTFNQSTIYIRGCSFFNNGAYSSSLEYGYGGVINADSVKIDISASKFVQNFATSSGGCAHIKNSILHIYNFGIFENNTATYGGAFTVRNGILHINRDSCDDFARFSGNSAQHGGALNIIENSHAHIQCSIFEYNGATFECENAMSDSSNCRGGAVLVRTNTTFSLVDTIFYENKASGKGGALFAQFSTLESHGYLVFESNQGVNATVYVTSCDANFMGNISFIHNEQSFLVRNSHIVFEGEISRFDGGVSTYSEGGAITAIRSDLHISGTLLIENNHGNHGGAINMIKSVLNASGQCRVQNNSADFGGALNAYNSLLHFRGITIFQYNTATMNGGGISARSSTIQFYSSSSTVTFSDNSACRGGAIYFDQTSSLYIVKEMMESPCNSWYCVSDTKEWMVLTFANNCATKQGGALYVNDTGATTCNSELYEMDPIYKTCFMQIVAAYEKANDWNTTGVNFANVYFMNNTSPEGQGPLLYGGLLDRCAIDEYAEQLQFVNTIPHPLSYFATMTNNSLVNNEVTSAAARICFCEDDKTINCSKEPEGISTNRGQLFNVTLVVVDQMSTPVKGEVMAYLSSSSATSGRLGEGQSQQTVDETCTDLQYKVFSSQLETLNLYAVGPCNNNGVSKAAVVIGIDPDCPVGFAPSESSLQCVCDPKITDFITNCSIDTKTVQKQGNFWIRSISDNTTNHFIIHNCLYDYCCSPTEIVSIDLNNFENGSDAQCAFNRVGILCGSCDEGYSLTLGSSRCQKCTHHWLLLIIPFSLTGIALVLLMMACNLTLVSGTLNGLLFYVNILIANQSTFFPFQKVNVLTVFISWLGLNLGIPICFFNGMDSFGKMWIQISFEAYLILLMVAIILLGRFVRVANFYHHHKLYPVHTLATISMLSYEKLSRKVFSLIAFTTLKYHDGTKYITVWLFDPTAEYFSKKHIPLVIVGVCIILTGIIFNFTLLFNKLLIAKCRSVYFKQFMQAFSAPYKPNHQYWVGLLLLLRNVSYLTSEVLNASQYPKYSLHVIFSLVVGILLLKFIYLGSPGVSVTRYFIRHGYGSSRNTNNDTAIILEREVSTEYPRIDKREMDNKLQEGIIYKNPYLDLLETSFLVNLSVLTYFTLYLKDDLKDKQCILFYISSSIVLLSFIGIIVYHICVYTSIKTLLINLRRKSANKERSRQTPQNASGDQSRYGSTSSTHSKVVYSTVPVPV